jgi:hypothetical protein
VSRDSEVRRVAAELDALLDELRESVDALNGILVPPADETDDGKELVP